MGLRDRLKRLEAIPPGEPCAVCGFDGDYSKLKIRVNVNRPLPTPDRCRECGRPLVIRVSGMRGDPAA